MSPRGRDLLLASRSSLRFDAGRRLAGVRGLLSARTCCAYRNGFSLVGNRRPRGDAYQGSAQSLLRNDLQTLALLLFGSDKKFSGAAAARRASCCARSINWSSISCAPSFASVGSRPPSTAPSSASSSRYSGAIYWIGSIPDRAPAHQPVAPGTCKPLPKWGCTRTNQTGSFKHCRRPATYVTRAEPRGDGQIVDLVAAEDFAQAAGRIVWCHAGDKSGREGGGGTLPGSKSLEALQQGLPLALRRRSDLSALALCGHPRGRFAPSSVWAAGRYLHTARP